MPDFLLRYFVLVVIACSAVAVRSFAAEPAAPPNFIVIVCDNLGYGDIEPFGSKLHRTPALNRMAREGRRFTHFCVTAGVCTPSRASFMTGCYAQRVGMHLNPRDGHVLRPVSPYGLHPDEVTLAESLKTEGYATGLIGKWHLGDQLPFLPTRQGFDTFFGIPYSDDMTRPVGQRIGQRLDGVLWPELPLMEGEQVVEAPAERNTLTERYTQRALKFIEDHRAKPFLLYLPQAMPGSTSKPFAGARFRGKSRNGPWGDSVEELDWSTGQILDKLVELKIQQRTLVIWTSDNGAPLDRDVTSPVRGSNQPLHGRGYTTAEGAFRVPTLMWWPGTVPAGTTCDQFCSSLDLLPSLTRLAGLLLTSSPAVKRQITVAWGKHARALLKRASPQDLEQRRNSVERVALHQLGRKPRPNQAAGDFGLAACRLTHRVTYGRPAHVACYPGRRKAEQIRLCSAPGYLVVPFQGILGTLARRSAGCQPAQARNKPRSAWNLPDVKSVGHEPPCCRGAGRVHIDDPVHRKSWRFSYDIPAPQRLLASGKHACAPPKQAGSLHYDAQPVHRKSWRFSLRRVSAQPSRYAMTCGIGSAPSTPTSFWSSPP